MKTNDFDYQLPKEYIAQEPLKERDTSRLLCLARDTGRVTHRIFGDLVNLVKPGDRLVFNNTRVIPARVFCRKVTGGRVELLFTKETDGNKWFAVVRPSRRVRKGDSVSVESDESIKLVIDDITEDGRRVVAVKEGPFDSIEEVIHAYGEMPLPPYIRRRARADDRITYQTVYAEYDGAVAAPTAGLHFTDALLKKLTGRGVDFSFVTLHVGIGTFRPVKAENPHDHIMHSEVYEISKKTADEINETRNEGGRIIAVGTTVVRVLEHCAKEDGSLQAGSGTTQLMILPGSRFKIIQGLITNFHLPRSTLLMLVSAFAGRENILSAYKKAIKKRYRFYSYGDAMFIV
jgi:S-adenosylmethionine:tRNA ribosyltransferase-isomerase